MAGTPEQRGRKSLSAEISRRADQYLEARAAAEDRTKSAVLRYILDEVMDRDERPIIGFTDPSNT